MCSASRLPVIGVPVCGDDAGQAGGADEAQKRVRLLCGVDESLFTGDGAAQEIGVVRHRSYGDLGDDEVSRLARVGRSSDLDLSGVAHALSLPAADGVRTRCSVGGSRYDEGRAEPGHRHRQNQDPQ
jgi:hypothetical protein